MRYRNGPGGLPGQIGRLTAAGYNPQKMSRSTLGPIFRDLPGSRGGFPGIHPSRRTNTTPGQAALKNVGGKSCAASRENAGTADAGPLLAGRSRAPGGHGSASSSGTNSRMSPGWQSRAAQMASSVEKRMALALLFFKMDRFAIVISTRWASSWAALKP